MRINSTLYYMLKDHLGSASVVTDASGTTVGEDRFYPYGETRFTTGTMYTDKLFTGQREMTGLGIYHYGARFYSPKLGRFLSPDTIVPSAANPQAWNRYSYVLGNPLKYTDPTGHAQCRTEEECDDMGTTPMGGSSGTPSNSSSKPKDPHDDDDADTVDLLDLPPSPFACEWFDCFLSAMSILASGIITAAPEVPELSVPAFGADLVVTFIAYGRTNSDYAHGKISKERQLILNITGWVGALPIPYVGLGVSILNGIFTGVGIIP
jgi:RHS repeat-associated protein